MMAQLLSLPACWGKIAQVSEDRGGVSERSQGIIFKEIVSSLKTAGMNPFEIQGFLFGLVEASPKIAGIKKVAIQPPPPITTAQPPPAAAAQQPPPATAQQPTPPATTAAPAGNLLDVGGGGLMNTIGNLAKKLPGASLLENAGDKWDVAVNDKNSPEYQAAAQNLINSEADKNHPFVSGLLKSFEGDPANRAKILNAFSKGDYMGALRMGGESLAANPTVKEWAPYVVPAAATMAATRLAGGTWGQGALLGAGAGAAYGGYIQPNGGFQASYRKMFGGQPTPDGKDPAASAPVISGQTAQQQNIGEQLTDAEQIQKDNQQSAQDILKTTAPAK